MKVQLKVSKNAIVEGSGETLLDVYKEVCALSEVFGESECGKCGGTDLKYQIRNAKDDSGEEYEYPEIVCNDRDCRARLALGLSKTNGQLYPKRYEMDGKKYILDDNGKKKVKGSWGWTIFNRETKVEE